jgi:dihydrofolate synthase/folylpolyglutamate synthase
MMAQLGQPQDRFRALHVAGTNGKGSVAASVASMLSRCGARVGLYTSPHLIDFRERIRVDGQILPDPLLEACASRLLPIADRVGATYFEVATALAFLAFAEAGVKEAVIETGLGGRWDATNVVRPAVSVITSLAVDHVEYLGSSLEAIAREKAGILKAGVPAVVAALAPEAHSVIEEVADRLRAPLSVLGADAAVESITVDLTGTEFVYRKAGSSAGQAMRTSLIGRHQAHNAGLSLLALEAWPRPLDPDVARAGLTEVELPGRFQIMSGKRGRWVLDIAHNPDAVARLTQTVAEVDLPGPLVLLAAVLRDKPWPEMAALLAGACDTAVLTMAPSAPGERRWDLDEAVRSGEWRRMEAHPSIDEAMRRARELAGVGTVLVTGSAHTVGDVLARLAD